MKLLFLSTWHSLAASGTVCLVFGLSVQDVENSVRPDGEETEGASLL